MSALSGQRIAVVGGGQIGASWSALFAHYGAAVTLWDPVTKTYEIADKRIRRARSQLAEICPAVEAGSVEFADDFAEALSGASLIQENAPESIQTKRHLYEDIEAVVADTAIIASSTSSLRWSDLSPGLRVSDRFVTAHPFHPPHLVPLVEIYGIDPSTCDRVEAIYRTTDRVTVRLKKDAVGHIANRLASALYREAVHIVAEEIADVEAVDTALINGPGLRWAAVGVHMGYHLGGGDGGLASYLDALGPSQERRWADLGTPVLDQSTKAALVAGVQAAAAGRDLPMLEAERDRLLIDSARKRLGRTFDEST